MSIDFYFLSFNVGGVGADAFHFSLCYGIAAFANFRFHNSPSPNRKRNSPHTHYTKKKHIRLSYSAVLMTTHYSTNILYVVLICKAAVLVLYAYWKLSKKKTIYRNNNNNKNVFNDRTRAHCYKGVLSTHTHTLTHVPINILWIFFISRAHGRTKIFHLSQITTTNVVFK